MKAREQECYHIYRRVQAFLLQWAALLSVVNGSALRQRFDALVDRLATLMARQQQEEQARRGGASYVAVLRTRLLEDHIEPIVAMSVILEPKFPNLRLKAPKADVSPTTLRSDAFSLANAIENIEHASSAFIELGLPPDFLEQLRAAARDLDVVFTGHDYAESATIGTSTGIATTIKEANEHLRAIATLVRKEIRARPDLVAEWDQVRRLPSHRSRGIRGPERPALAAPPQPLLLNAGTAEAEVAPADGESASETPSTDVVNVVDVGGAPPAPRLWAKARLLLGGG